MIANLLAGVAAAVLAVFVVLLRRRVNALESAAREERERIRAILQMLDGAVERLSEKVTEAADRAGVLVAPAAPRSGLNLGKRSHALRLHRHGESPHKIASDLDLPQAEVNLLLKIHQLVIKLS